MYSHEGTTRGFLVGEGTRAVFLVTETGAEGAGFEGVADLMDPAATFVMVAAGVGVDVAVVFEAVVEAEVEVVISGSTENERRRRVALGGVGAAAAAGFFRAATAAFFVVGFLMTEALACVEDPAARGVAWRGGRDAKSSARAVRRVSSSSKGLACLLAWRVVLRR